jgi:hypothetical protein
MFASPDEMAYAPAPTRIVRPEPAKPGREPEPPPRRVDLPGEARRGAPKLKGVEQNWNKAVAVFIALSLIYMSIRIWLLGALFTLSSLILVHLVGADYENQGISVFGFGILTWWHLVPLGISLLEYNFMPYVFNGFGWKWPLRRNAMERWKFWVWWAAFLIDVGTSYGGVTTWLRGEIIENVAQGVVLPLFGGIHLPSEGLALWFLATGISAAISYTPEPLIRRVVSDIGRTLKLV